MVDRDGRLQVPGAGYAEVQVDAADLAAVKSLGVDHAGFRESVGVEPTTGADDALFHERVRAWGLYVCLLALITISIAIYLGITYNMLNGTQQLIPALQDQPILTVHVSMAIFAYALFSVAFGAGLIILIQNGEGQRFSWLPSAEAADELGYKAVIVGFPLLALTLILGAYWANYAWGHYWSWDPKETSALITWLIYAVYLHARGIRDWRGKRAGWHAG